MLRKLILVNPPFPVEARYVGSMKDVASILPKIGILYVAAAAEKAGYEVEVIDAALENLDAQSIERRINDSHPDIIGITTETPNFARSASLASAIKKKFSLPIVFGGPHPTLLPGEVLKQDGIDYVVIGEGEQTLIELLDVINSGNVLRSLEKVRGIGFKKNGRIVINSPRDRITDLDSLETPAYHLLDLKSYKPSPHQYRRLPLASMTMSRGCPFGCTFCSSSSVWGRRYVVRSVDNVIAEIVQLQERYGIKEIFFTDDLWGASPGWAEDFCDRVIREGLNLSFSCNCRVDTVTEPMLKKMAQAGCWRIFFGIETLDDDILKNIEKNFDTKNIHKAVTWTMNNGIEIHGNFILGMPGETPEKAGMMVDKICRMPFDYVKFNVLTPYPGTKLYNQIKSGQWGIYEERHDRLSSHHVTFRPFGYKSFEELDAMRRYATRRFYLRPSYAFRRIMSMRSFEDLRRNYIGFKTIARF